MSNNFLITQGTGTTVATEQGTGTEHYQKIKLIDPTPGATGGIGITGTPLKVDGSAVTQPVSIATMPSTPVTGTFFQVTQPVSLASLPSLATGSNAIGSVSISNFPATQPISGSVTANVGTTNGLALDATLTSGNEKVQIVQGGNTALVSSAGALSIDINQIGTNALGQELMAASIPVVIASNQSSIPVTIGNPVQVASANLCISATGATGTAVTATLPAVASQFHYITLIEIHKFFTAANAASATPLVVTTTNLPGSLAFTFGQPVGAIGVTDERVYAPNSPLKSSVANTATTIVCPATTGLIWRVNVFYFSAT